MQGVHSFVRSLPNFGFLNENFFIPLTKSIMNDRVFQTFVIEVDL